jgi:urease accessory protein
MHITSPLMNAQPNVAIAEHTNWHAELQLTFAAQGARTVLSHRKHIGPLVVQRPFYPEGTPEQSPCHVYLVHPPGGIAGGDHLHLQARLLRDTRALITTPAATKFYRTLPGRKAVLHQHIQAEAAVLEWLPQETIYFNQADARTLTRIEVDAQSRVLAWEVNCYGRRAGNEPFESGQIRQRFELWVAGRPLLLDHLHIQGGQAMQHAAWGLQAKTALGSLLAYPASADDVRVVRELLPGAQQLSCTLIDGALLCRCLCDEGAEVKQILQDVWRVLRPRIVQREPVMPRIWAT